MRVGRVAPTLVGAGVLLGVLWIALGGSSSRSGERSAADPGTPGRFTYLAAQRSNRCDLSAAAVRAMPRGQHLEGSCCTAMDDDRYQAQVQALTRYRQETIIPRDPYGIPVGLVERLLRMDAAIKLSSGEMRSYRTAMKLSATGGPCCCRCWRWEAFRGLSKYLLAGRGWSARQLATLIGDLDGCGGASST